MPDARDHTEANRAIMRSLVDTVRDHLTECHPGEDIDCVGANVIIAMRGVGMSRLAAMLEIALCALARLPDDRPTLDAFEAQLAQMDADPREGDAP